MTGPISPDVEGLAELLHAVVHEGASVSFILPFSMDEARVFWRDRVLPAVRQRARRLWVARLDGRIVGAVQLILDTPPNQKHRAEIAKLLVHPEARRRGIARALMNAAESAAREERRTLITLDTRTGDRAEPLYRSLGYEVAGIIPGYSKAPDSDALEATTILYKKTCAN
jgi:ribosomal protein S18 acetylase RimI-like enzyme